MLATLTLVKTEINVQWLIKKMEELGTAYTGYDLIPMMIFGLLAYVTKTIAKDIKHEDTTEYKE